MVPTPPPHALSHNICERHPRSHTTSLLGIDIDVEGLARGLPKELGVEAGDGGARVAFRRNHSFPFVVVVDAIAANHVDLAEENRGWPAGDAGGRRAPVRLFLLVMQAVGGHR